MRSRDPGANWFFINQHRKEREEEGERERGKYTVSSAMYWNRSIVSLGPEKRVQQRGELDKGVRREEGELLRYNPRVSVPDANEGLSNDPQSKGVEMRRENERKRQTNVTLKQIFHLQEIISPVWRSGLLFSPFTTNCILLHAVWNISKKLQYCIRFSVSLGSFFLFFRIHWIGNTKTSGASSLHSQAFRNRPKKNEPQTIFQKLKILNVGQDASKHFFHQENAAEAFKEMELHKKILVNTRVCILLSCMRRERGERTRRLLTRSPRSAIPVSKCRIEMGLGCSLAGKGYKGVNRKCLLLWFWSFGLFVCQKTSWRSVDTATSLNLQSWHILRSLWLDYQGQDLEEPLYVIRTALIWGYGIYKYTYIYRHFFKPLFTCVFISMCKSTESKSRVGSSIYRALSLWNTLYFAIHT